jgi:ABC-type Fe3+/spermidine/putrescine transport system ATPase subunit
VADFIGQTNFFIGTVEDAGSTTLVRDQGGRLLRCAATGSERRGMQVAVSVRPEKIMPAEGPKDGNVLEGILARRIYLGDLVQFHIALEDGVELTMQRQNDARDVATEWELGQRVDVWFSDQSALVLEDDASAIADEEDRRLVEAR